MQDLIQKYYPQLYRYCQQHTTNHQDCQDLLQISACKMVEKAHQFDEARGFLPWAKVVIYRCFVDEWRKEQRKIQTTELEEEITEDYLPAPSIVRDVLVSMGKEHRYLLAALYMHGMTQKELAEELGVSVSYIKRHVDKAKKSFTRYYDEYNHAIGESYC